MSAHKKRKTAEGEESHQTEYAPYFMAPGAILSKDQILQAIECGFVLFSRFGRETIHILQKLIFPMDSVANFFGFASFACSDIEISPFDPTAVGVARFVIFIHDQSHSQRYTITKSAFPFRFSCKSGTTPRGRREKSYKRTTLPKPNPSATRIGCGLASSFRCPDQLHI